MSRFNDADDPRRRVLLKALAAGALGSGLPAEASFFGSVPRKLAPGRSIHSIDGRVLVNGVVATKSTTIGPNDTIETADNGNIVFVVGKDAYILRGGSKLVLSEQPRNPGVAETLQLLAGRLLSVFARGRHTIRTTTAVIGVRGTGIYMETNPEESYLCTCYGTVDLYSRNDKTSRERIVSTHHDKPRYIVAKGSAGKLIRPAPVIDHTDLELMLIEELVGRTPPFVFPRDDYGGPRREY